MQGNCRESARGHGMRHNKMLRIIAVSLFTVLLIGCGKPAEKPSAARPPDRLIAKVNGEPIYNKDLKLSLALRLKDDPTFKITPNTMKEQIDLVIDERLKLQHKERAGSRIEIFE